MIFSEEFIKALSDSELIELYKKAKESVERVWGNSSDGDYECAWSMEVEPYEIEIKKRGLTI